MGGGPSTAAKSATAAAVDVPTSTEDGSPHAPPRLGSQSAAPASSSLSPPADDSHGNGSAGDAAAAAATDGEAASLAVTHVVAPAGERASPPSAPPVGVLLVWDPRCLLHLAHTHPDDIWHEDHQKEQPRRLRESVARLRDAGLLDDPGVAQSGCVAASREQLLRVHTAEHVARVQALDTRSDAEAASAGGRGHLDGDLATALMAPGDGGLEDALVAAGNAARGYVYDAAHSVYSCDETPAVAALAAGGVVCAVDALATGAATAAFALVRPPGHHCSASTPGGFCWYNNVAVGVRHAQAVHGVRRVAVVDIDVHHGDGTQAVFHDDPHVLVLSVHRYMPHAGFGFYPGSGAPDDVGMGTGAGASVNVALPYFGLGDAEYVAVLERALLPLLSEFQPELILVSAGFDAAHGDPLGLMHVTPPGFRHMIAAIASLAPPRGVAVVLEGGYNLDSVAADAEAVMRGLLDAVTGAPAGADAERGSGQTPLPPRPPLLLLPPQECPAPFVHPAALLALRNVAAAHAPYWACMRELHAAPWRLLPQQTVGTAPHRGTEGETSLAPDYQYNHQQRRRWEFGKHVEPAAAGDGWLLVSYARPHFPRTRFTYSDSAYSDPVRDLHVYALMTAQQRRSDAEAGVPEAAAGGSLGWGQTDAALEEATSTPAAATITPRKAPYGVGHGETGKPPSSCDSASRVRTRSQAAAARWSDTKLAADTPADAAPTRAPHSPTALDTVAQSSRDVASAIEGADDAPVPDISKLTLGTRAPPHNPDGAAAPPEATTATTATPAHQVVRAEPPFWKPFGPCQAWIRSERWHATEADARHALAAGAHKDKTAAATGGRGRGGTGRRRGRGGKGGGGIGTGGGPAATDSLASDGSASDEDGQEEVMAAAGVRVPPPRTPALLAHSLVITDMSGRCLLRLDLHVPLPGGAASAAVRGSGCADSGLPGALLRLRGSAGESHGCGFTSAAGPAPAAAPTSWWLLDGSGPDAHGESRVLVFPGGEATYAAAHSSAQTVAVGPLPPPHPDRVAASLASITGAGAEAAVPLHGSDAAWAATPLVPLLRAGDFVPAALRLYFGDERDDDKVEKGQFVGREGAARFTSLLERFGELVGAGK